MWLDSYDCTSLMLSEVVLSSAAISGVETTASNIAIGFTTLTIGVCYSSIDSGALFTAFKIK